LLRKKLSIRRITRTVSLSDSELQARSEDFLCKIGTQVRSQPSTIFLNMDQTAIESNMIPNNTIEVRGSKAVACNKKTKSIGRVTAILAVCSNGERLWPMLVFKGTRGGRVHRQVRSIAMGFPNRLYCLVQKKAWTDEDIMLEWIDQ
jgi:hypothetical protein